jgi:hypothetical protein
MCKSISFPRSLMPALLCGFTEVGENQPEYIARIIKRVTTLEVYQEELVERTTEATVSSAFPAFQRSNLAIFRGEAPSRKIGVRAANQRCFMQPPRLKEILSNIFYRFLVLTNYEGSLLPASPPVTSLYSENKKKHCLH